MAEKDQEKKLVQRIIEKEDAAIIQFYKAHHTSLYRFIFHKIKDPHAADELVQDTFLDFIEALRDFHFQCSLKTYLYTIANYKVIDSIRKKKLKRILFSSLPSYVVESLMSVFDESLEKQELKDKMKQVFDELPNDYQLVLRLKYMEGQKVQSIAKKLSMKFKATESLIFRARRAFVKVFSKLP